MKVAIQQNRHQTILVFLLLCCTALSCTQKPDAVPERQPATNAAPGNANQTAAVGTAATGNAVAPMAAPPVAPAVSGPTPIPLEGKDFDVKLLDASATKLSQLLARRKVVVINFWATWCGPCRQEIPELIAVQNTFKANQDVEIYGLSVEDPAQFQPLVKEYGKQFQINYKLGFSPVPMFMAFNGARPGAPIPQTFIFGKDGKLRQHIPGLRPAFRAFLEQTIDLALKG